MADPDGSDDAWTDARAYERFMGRWSRAAAREFVRRLDAPPNAAWIDVGCGTGALAHGILDLAAPAAVTGVEPAPGFLAFARRQFDDARIRFVAGAAGALPLPPHAADVAASAFVLNFVPDPGAALRDMARVVRPGGAVAALVWDYREGMEFLRRFWSAVTDLDPGARHFDEGIRFPLCRPGPLRELFAAAGLHAVRVDTIEIPTRFADFADCWEPFLGGTGPAPSYLATRSPAQRRALRARLEALLPVAADGSVTLTARAWGVWGRTAGS